MSITEYGFDTSLYPEILSTGSLPAAIQATSSRMRIDLGTVSSSYSSGPGLFSTAKVDSSRGPVYIQIDTKRREFYAEFHGRGFTWAHGWTESLDSLVDALGSWRGGISANDLTTRFTFITASRMAAIYESDNPTAAQWDYLRHSELYIEERDLIESVYQDGRLTHLFPYLSHKTLRLNFSLGAPGSREIHLALLREGKYLVDEPSKRRSAKFSSVQEALDTAAALVADEI